MSLLAAPRDASFFNSPSTHTGPRSHFAHAWHVVREGTVQGRCGNPILKVDQAIPAAHVSPGERCQRNGCKQAWPRSGASS